VRKHKHLYSLRSMTRRPWKRPGQPWRIILKIMRNCSVRRRQRPAPESPRTRRKRGPWKRSHVHRNRARPDRLVMLPVQPDEGAEAEVDGDEVVGLLKQHYQLSDRLSRRVRLRTKRRFRMRLHVRPRVW